MINNKFIKLFLEIFGHQKSTFLISQYIDVCLHQLAHSILNIRRERCLKQFHKISIFASGNAPWSILCAYKQCCGYITIFK